LNEGDCGGCGGHVDCNGLIDVLRCGVNQSAEGTDCSALFANYFSEVSGGGDHVKDGPIFLFSDELDDDCIRVDDQNPDHGIYSVSQLDQIWHVEQILTLV
jgi:hypothetical protein